MRRIRMKKSRKYEQDKLQAEINASARRALDDLEKSSGMLSRDGRKIQKNCTGLQRTSET